MSMLFGWYFGRGLLMLVGLPWQLFVINLSRLGTDTFVSLIAVHQGIASKKFGGNYAINLVLFSYSLGFLTVRNSFGAV